MKHQRVRQNSIQMLIFQTQIFQLMMMMMIPIHLHVKTILLMKMKIKRGE